MGTGKVKQTKSAKTLDPDRAEFWAQYNQLLDAAASGAPEPEPATLQELGERIDLQWGVEEALSRTDPCSHDGGVERETRARRIFPWAHLRFQEIAGHDIDFALTNSWSDNLVTLRGRCVGSGPAGIGDGSKPQEFTWEVPWDKENPDFIQSGQARVKYTACRLPESTLSRKLGTIPVHYMRAPGKGSRVHGREFGVWARQDYPEANLTDDQREEITDEGIADREAMKQSSRRK
jgi:hypothetical protein